MEQDTITTRLQFKLKFYKKMKQSQNLKLNLVAQESIPMFIQFQLLQLILSSLLLLSQLPDQPLLSNQSQFSQPPDPLQFSQSQFNQ